MKQFKIKTYITKNIQDKTKIDQTTYIFFDYDPENVKIVKTLKNRKYDPAGKYWETNLSYKEIANTLKEYDCIFENHINICLDKKGYEFIDSNYIEAISDKHKIINKVSGFGCVRADEVRNIYKAHCKIIDIKNNSGTDYITIEKSELNDKEFIKQTIIANDKNDRCGEQRFQFEDFDCIENYNQIKNELINEGVIEVIEDTIVKIKKEQK